MSKKCLERELLAAIITNRLPVSMAEIGLAPEDFGEKKHQFIWEAITALTNSGVTPTPTLVEDRLKDEGKFKAAGGLKYMTALMPSAVLVSDPVDHADRIREAAQERKRMGAIALLTAKVAIPGADIAAIGAEMQRLAALDKPLDELEREQFELSKELMMARMEECPAKRSLMMRNIAEQYRIGTQKLEQVGAELEAREAPVHQTRFNQKAFLDWKAQKLEWLIPGYLPKSEFMLLCSTAGYGKSNLVGDMTRAMLTGGEFLGEKAKKSKILYIGSDESQATTTRRFEDAGINDALREAEELGENVFEYWSSFSVLNCAGLARHLAETRPDVVIIDSLTSIFEGSGIPENESAIAGPLCRLRDTVCAYGASLVLIHHANKREGNGLDRIAGSNRIAAVVWGAFVLDRPNQKNQADPTRKLSLVKGREIQQFTKTIKINYRDNWIDDGIFTLVEDEHDEKVREARGRIITMLAEEGTALASDEIRDRLGYAYEVTGQALSDLVQRTTVDRRRSTAPGKKSWVYELTREDVPPTEPINETEALIQAIAAASAEERRKLILSIDTALLMSALDLINDDALINDILAIAAER